MKIGHDEAVKLAEALRNAFSSRVGDGMHVSLGDVKNVTDHMGYNNMGTTNLLLRIIFTLLKGKQTTETEPKYIVKDVDVHHPTHYNTHECECIVEMYILFGVDKFIDFCTMNAWKYRYRAGRKAGSAYDQDNAKADRYIEYARRAKECVYWELDPNRLTDDNFWDDFYNRTYRVKGLTPTMSPDIYQETPEDA